MSKKRHRKSCFTSGQDDLPPSGGLPFLKCCPWFKVSWLMDLYRLKDCRGSHASSDAHCYNAVFLILAFK